MEVKVFSVGELSVMIKQMFDSNSELRSVTISGELSNFKHHSSGHFYFTLKEDNFAIDGVMFKSKVTLNQRKHGFVPKDGMHVVIQGSVSTYPSRGSYQIYAEEMKEEGVGDIYKRLEELKVLLSKKGYFDPAHKKPLPKYPKQIAVLTSKTGAAVRDIINTINRRFPFAEILLYPTTVQGENAKFEIVKNIEKANEIGADVMIVGRGGGSIEDLWAFNEEIVCEAIYHSKIPIVSAVGHETDTTLSDFVADARAATPTAAAELVVRDRLEVAAEVSGQQNRIYNALFKRLKQDGTNFVRLRDSYVFTDPSRIIQMKELKFDHLMTSLEKGSPKAKVVLMEERFVQNEKNLTKNYKDYLVMLQNQFMNQITRLELSSPLGIMKKGYSLAYHDGALLKSKEQVNIGDELDLQFTDGLIKAKVTNKE